MNKADNQEIAAKVSKVKEVVRGVSNDDIILALHSYDFNVERTIQAFCEDGASGVLDDWVRPAGSSGKKNKNKKKNKNAQVVAPATPQVVEQPKKTAPVSVPTTGVTSVSTPVASAPVTKAAPAKVVNGVSKAAKEAEKPKTNNKNAAVSEQVHNTFQTLRTILNEREKVLLGSLKPQSSFSADLSQLVAFINNFGLVHDAAAKPISSPTKSVSPVQVAAIKHATSQSSITSSVGADSGVNLSPVHSGNEQKKGSNQSVHVTCGGIQMSSDGLSADQLAAIKQSLEERLAATGIDASVINGAQAVRRPKKTNENRAKSQKDGAKNAQRPKLSILNA
ncbi:unnamed protein product [Auanema sp. JU1783]|nr:unnamed protein product [Auanema sp. JU1783]